MEGGEHGACLGSPLDDHRAQSRTDGGFEGGGPSVVDVHQILEDAEDTRRLAQDVGAGSGPLVGDLAGQRLGACLEPVTLALGAAQRLLGVAKSPLGVVGDTATFRGASRQPGVLRRKLAELMRHVGDLGLQSLATEVDGLEPLVGAHEGTLLALERAAQRLDTASGHGKGLLGGVLPGEVGEGGLVGGDVTGQGVLGATDLLGLGRQGVVLVGGGLELGRQARRVGFERGHHVGVGRRFEGACDGATPFGHDAEQSPAALRQSLHPGERHHEVLFSLGGELGRGGLGRRIELGDRGHEHGLGLGQPAALHRRRLLAGVESRQLFPDEVQPQGAQLVGQRRVRAGRGRLAFEGTDLAAHLAQQVPEAVEVLFGGGQAALGPLPSAPVLQDPGGFLDDGATVLGSGIENGAQLALAHDHVLLTSHPGVRQHLLDVEEAAGLAVDGVLALAGPEERAGDRDLGQPAREPTRAVVDGERHLGPPQLRPVGGAGEDDVLHLRRAHRARSLCAEHPGHGVDHVGLPTAVRADHHRDAGLHEQR